MSDSNTDKKPEKLVVADDDNVPHLENMANVQGSNKDRPPAKSVEQEKNADSRKNASVEG